MEDKVRVAFVSFLEIYDVVLNSRTSFGLASFFLLPC